MLIREASTNDIAVLHEIFQELHKIHFENRPDIFSVDGNPYTEKFIKKMLRDKSKKIIVAEENTYVIGLCAFSLNDNAYQTRKKQILIDDIYVVPDYRRKGVAKALFNYVKSLAEKEKYEKIDLTVWNFNKEAQSFYESLGFTEQRRIMELNIE
jgi:ribosomal protein S18 acetylase RimI-like enzyme